MLTKYLALFEDDLRLGGAAGHRPSAFWLAGNGGCRLPDALQKPAATAEPVSVSLAPGYD